MLQHCLSSEIVPAKASRSGLLIYLSLATMVSAAEPVTVKLQSGRCFTAEVAARTDEQCLWLRFRTAGVTLLRPVEWQRVVEAHYQGQVLTANELKRLVPELVVGEPPAPAEFALAPAASMRPNPLVPAPARSTSVVSVDFAARVANWDGDVEADGLVLQVFPLDEDGNAVSVTGTLEVDLIGYRVRDFSAASQSRGYVLDRLGHWSQGVSASDLKPAGIRVKLPFQSTQPEFNSQLGIYGIVHVRLVVPGQGVFESSQDAVRLRSFAPTRDVLEQQHQRRFFPVERTGGG